MSVIRYDLAYDFDEDYQEWDCKVREDPKGSFVLYKDVEEYINIVNFYLPHALGKSKEELRT